MLQRIARELRVWSSLKHPNIVPLLGLWDQFSGPGACPSYPVPIMPWMDGDLEGYIRSNPTLPLTDRLNIVRDYSLHRDLTESLCNVPLIRLKRLPAPFTTVSH